MSVDRRYLILGLMLLAGATWWLLRDSPEDQVRAAHAELARLLSKAETDGATPSLRDALAYQAMFADPAEVTGDAGGLDGTYSPEEMAALITRVRALFRTIELTFGEIDVELPGTDLAVADFTAELRTDPDISESADGVETRSVTSRMQRLDGRWVFSRIQLTRKDQR